MDLFYVKTKIFTGEDAFSSLRDFPIKRAAIICDPFIESSGMILKLTDTLSAMGAQYDIFSDIVPDPPTENIIEGVTKISKFMPDTIIAMGGGSAIDAAKAISFVYQRVTKQDKPLCVAVPTTSGTGSEVTAVSVITDSAAGVKYPLVDDNLLPNIAILDPTLTRTVPPHITADTGMDVLTHAIEAYVSTMANDFSDAMAEKAVRLIFEYLPRAYKNGDDMRARGKVHNASCMAGVAFNQVFLGINHSIAHVVGAKFHVPHGRANAIVMPTVIEFNAALRGSHGDDYSKAAKKYKKLARTLGIPSLNPRQAVHSLVDDIRNMLIDMKVPLTFAEQGIDKDEYYALIDEMAATALNDVCTPTNPRKPSFEEMIELFKICYSGTSGYNSTKM